MIDKVLSISIAAYNVEQFLEMTLDSLLCSENILKKLDVLIVDDGSADRTSEIAQKYVNLYPETFRLIKKENGGHGSTLNTSVFEAKGKYFKMLDGDDWYETSELEKLIQELEKLKVDIILSPYQRVYEADGRRETINRHKLEIGRAYSILDCSEGEIEEVHAAELTVRTSLLQENHFQILEKCAFTDDQYVFAAIAHAKTYMKLSSMVYRYRIGVEGQTVGEEGRRRHWLDARRVVIAMLSTLSETNNIEPMHEKALYRFIKRTAEFQLNNLDFGEDMLESEKEFRNFVKSMEDINQEFKCYMESESELFKWWKWLFSLSQTLKGESCKVFGAGRFGERVVRYLKDHQIEILELLDNDNNLWGKNKWEIPIKNPADVMVDNTDSEIIIAVKNQAKEIAVQLETMGVHNSKIIVFGK